MPISRVRRKSLIGNTVINRRESDADSIQLWCGIAKTEYTASPDTGDLPPGGLLPDRSIWECMGGVVGYSRCHPTLGEPPSSMRWEPYLLIKQAYPPIFSLTPKASGSARLQSCEVHDINRAVYTFGRNRLSKNTVESIRKMFM